MAILDTSWNDTGLKVLACPTCGGRGYVVTCEGCMDAGRCPECNGGRFVYDDPSDD